MIYGPNFGGAQIPEAVRRKFGDRRRFTIAGNFPDAGEQRIASLVGATDDISEVPYMFVVADNGHRLIWRTSATIGRGTKRRMWYAVYVY